MASAETEATTPGNYFVSNYPPFSFWSPEHLPRLREALARPPVPGVPLGIYHHIPFCRKRCHFCYFKVYTGKNATEVQAYLEATLQELAIHARQPAFSHRAPGFVYFGGGTPSYLSESQLAELVSGMRSLVPWRGVDEVTFECEPGTLSASKLRVLRDLGVTRISLGIESFVEELLQANGRAHHAGDILVAYERARGEGFPEINIDLIAGMVGETDLTWRTSIDRTLELAPESITIYQMEAPYNTTLVKEMRERGGTDLPVADWPRKRAWVRDAFARLEVAGYTVTSAYTAVRNPSSSRFVYRHQLWHGADLLGLGVSSFSHLSGVHFQNEPDIGRYLARVEQGELPVQRALPLTTEERMIRELVLQLKLGRIDRPYLESKFGVDVEDRFQEPLEELRRAGFLEPSGEPVLTRDALLQVDRLLEGFFLPRHRGARYV